MAAIDDIAALLKSAGLDPRQANGVLEAFRIALTGSSSLTVKEGGTTVSSSITTLDFGAGFDVTESPSGEANIAPDLAEMSYDNSTSGLAATNPQAAIDELAASANTASVPYQWDDTYTMTAPQWLSVDLLTLANSIINSSYAAAVSHDCKLSDGNVYFEVAVTGTPGIRDAVGIVLTDAAERVRGQIQDYSIESGSVSFYYVVYRSDGQMSYRNVTANGGAAFGTAWTTPCNIGVAVNRSSGKVYFFLDGAIQGGFDIALDDATGGFSDASWKYRFRAYASCYTNGMSMELLARSADQVYGPPSGYVALCG